jgi:photosystem II stability/assembly factor-like uncharacterized protein
VILEIHFFEVVMMKTRNLLKMVLMCVTLGACGGDGSPDDSPDLKFEYFGLNDHMVSQITAYDKDAPLFVATDKGIYELTDEREWELRGSENWHVNTIEILSPEHILASVTVEGRHKLMESLNGGTDWDEVASNFGGDDEVQEQIRNLLFDEDNDVLYGVGLGVLARSGDWGRDWTLVDGNWKTLASGLSALQLHPYTGDLWIGGQGAIENPVMRQIDASGGEPVDHSTAVAELLEVPSVVKSIRFFTNDAERILASGEGGIIQSLDDGQTWQPLRVNQQSRFYFDVLIDPQDPDTLYTAGWDKNFDEPQELRVEVSRDGGKTWSIHKYPDPQLRGGVWSMMLRTEGNDKVLYLGLCNGGVFRVEVR